MGVLLLALKVLGWVLLALLALLVLALLLPVGLILEVDYDRFTAKVRAFGLTFRLYPRKPRKEKKRRQRYEPQHLRKTEEAAPEAPQETDTPEADGAHRHMPKLSQLADIAATAGKLARAFLRIIRISDVQLVLPVHHEDAAQTAIEYGRVHAALGGILGVLQNCFEIRLKKVEIIPDFMGDSKYRRYFYCKIGATPFIILSTALYVLWRMRKGAAAKT